MMLTRKFERVIHLVGSSTVLGYLHKEDQKLRPFEGVRVAEIQASGHMEKGHLKDWTWIESELNPADWVTKPRKVKELVAKGFWQNGPDFLRTDYESWLIKKSFKTKRLDGKLDPKGAASS